MDTAADKKAMERIQQREEARLNVLQEREKKRVEKESDGVRTRGGGGQVPNKGKGKAAAAGKKSEGGKARKRGRIVVDSDSSENEKSAFRARKPKPTAAADKATPPRNPSCMLSDSLTQDGFTVLEQTAPSAEALKLDGLKTLKKEGWQVAFFLETEEPPAWFVGAICGVKAAAPYTWIRFGTTARDDLKVHLDPDTYGEFCNWLLVKRDDKAN